MSAEQIANTGMRVKVAGYARDTATRARVRSSPVALFAVAHAYVELNRFAVGQIRRYWFGR